MAQILPLLDVVLVHYPVVNRHGDIIGSAVTNLDLHDIARAGKTYGVHTYWVVTPFQEQRELVEEIVQHWTKGYGATANPDRRSALELIAAAGDLDEVIAKATAKFGVRPTVVATCAHEQKNTIDFATVRNGLREGKPYLLVFGTAWGLAPGVMTSADAVLPPLLGRCEFNHLSVRSAASIILDRLLHPEED